MVIEEITKKARDQNVGLAFLYCDYKDQDRQTALGLTGSLVQQLSARKDDLCNSVVQYFSELDQKGIKPKVEDYKSLLLSSCKAFSRTFIVVDALDECNAEVRRSFLPILTALEENSIKVLVTSRPNLEDIRMHFSSALHTEIVAAETDVRRYLEERMTLNVPFMKRVNKSLFNRIVDTVASRASGMYVYSL